MRPQADMSARLGGITCKSSHKFNTRNLRFRPEWGNHNSAWGNAPGRKSMNPPSPNGAAQIDDRRTNDMINTNCSALTGLNRSNRSPSQGVALGSHVDGPLGRITEGSGST